MITAHIITRRPGLAPKAIETAQGLADRVVVGLHAIDVRTDADTLTGDDYVDLTNRVLAEAGPSLRIDDDDYYPSDHAEIYDLWKPGYTVWGLVTIKACSGQVLKRDHPDMCAGVIPPVTVYPDRLGRVADSLRAQTKPLYVKTGVIKMVCLADASWLHSPRWRKIDCSHTERATWG